MKPRVKCQLLGEGDQSFCVVWRKGSIARLTDVYKYKSFEKAFWARM